MLEAINPATGQPIFGEIMQQFMLAVFSILSLLISALLTWLFAKLSTVLPAWLLARTDKDNALLDEKFKRDVHDAAITAARRLVLEHEDPMKGLRDAVDYVMQSARDATERWLSQGRTREEVRSIYEKIITSKFPNVLTELNTARNTGLQFQMAHSVQSAPEPGPEQ